KKAKEIEILGIKAELYENELSKPIWVEGVGECIMDENKTMKDCEKLALEYARRDAVEKGGVSLIESVTEIKMFELTKDDIKKTAKVNIIDQDNTSDFGKVKKIPFGDTFKFTVTVRLKIQSVTTYNPYREKMKGLQGEEKQVSTSPEEDKAVSSKPAVSHTIGEYYGGGIVFFVDDSGQHGLIAATKDQSTKAKWNNAVKICASYRGGGYSDWYLPSREELNLLQKQRNVVGGFANERIYYWSSTEGSYGAWYQGFSFGTQHDGSKGLKVYVRAVRAF
ncbi:MAG: DUF1566 domain-containing protein, partial [Candidatus Desantisbacteria bacterium]